MKLRCKKRIVILVFLILLCAYCGSYLWIANSRTIEVGEALYKINAAVKEMQEKPNDKKNEADINEMEETIGKDATWFPISKNAYYFYWPLCYLDYTVNSRIAIFDPEKQAIFKNLEKTVEYLKRLQSMGMMMEAMAKDNAELAGEWEDDPENWKRAFGSELPEGIKILHSYYWKSDHWTDEYIYYFIIEPNASAKAELIKNRKKETIPAERANWPVNTPANAPDWFKLGVNNEYEYFKKPESREQLWLEKRTGKIYIYNSQL